MRKKKKIPKKKNGLPRRFIWRLGIFERIEAIAIMTYSSFCFSKSSSLPLLLLGFVWTCSLVLTLLIRTVRTKIDNFFSFLKKKTTLYLLIPRWFFGPTNRKQREGNIHTYQVGRPWCWQKPHRSHQLQLYPKVPEPILLIELPLCKDKKLRDCEMVGEIKKTGYVFYAVKNKIKKSRKAGSQPQNLIFQVPIKQVI